MKMQKSINLLLVLIVSTLIAVALAAPADDKCAKANCKSGTKCRLVRDVPTCQCNDTVCSDEWRPVCGTDAKTYPNKCHLSASVCGDNKALRVAHIGRCIKPPSGRS